jgi:hypothetical protein
MSRLNDELAELIATSRRLMAETHRLLERVQAQQNALRIRTQHRALQALSTKPQVQSDLSEDDG